MSHRQFIAQQSLRPGPLFVVLLSAIFGVEFSVMLVLPAMMPNGSSVLFTALVDACFLTSVLAPVIWYLVVRPLRQLADLRLHLFARILTAQEEERQRIARDLHDELGQSLTRLLVGLRTIEEATREETVRQLAHDLRRIGTDTHEEIRRLARGLRPLVLDDMGLLPALERLLAELVAVHDVDARLTDDSTAVPRQSPHIETALYRIAQEAVSNAIRHGHATEIRLRVTADQKEVHLSVDDNGAGFDPDVALQQTGSSSPFGLISMRERAALCDGDLGIQSSAGSGTSIHVHIPLIHSGVDA